MIFNVHTDGFSFLVGLKLSRIGDVVDWKQDIWLVSKPINDSWLVQVDFGVELSVDRDLQAAGANALLRGGVNIALYGEGEGVFELQV